jgi:hypothetical protein
MASWQTICPVWSGYPDGGQLDEPFEFGRRVSIGRIERAPLSAVTVSDLSRDDREDVRRARLSFLAEYDAEGFGDPDPEWKRIQPRSIQKNSHDRIQLANLALWLIKPSALGFAVIAHQSGVDSFSSTEWRIRASDAYSESRLVRSDLEAARDYFLALCAPPQDRADMGCGSYSFQSFGGRRGLGSVPTAMDRPRSSFRPN